MTLSRLECVLTFIESPTFTRLIIGLVGDDDYAAFQQERAAQSDKGGPMSGCGGVRKVRLAVRGKA